MRLYTAHFRPADAARGDRPPMMVKEGVSWPCLVFGWLGLLLSGSWIAALLAGAVTITLGVLFRHAAGAWPVLAGLHLLLGLFGNALHGWELRLQGFTAGAVVAGSDADHALLRLLDQRPELVGSHP